MSKKVDRQIIDQLVGLCGEKHMITITDEERTNFLCASVDFARKMEGKGQSNEIYIEERYADPAKLPFDQLQGKYAEQIVSKWFMEKLGISMKPDFEVYKKDEKSHSRDLICDDPNLKDKLPGINVKSCVRNKNHLNSIEKSWVFQLRPNKDSLLGLSIIEQFNQVIACVFLSAYDAAEADIYFIPWRIIMKRKMLYDPKIVKFIGVKECLYEEHVLQIQKMDLKKELYNLADIEDNRLLRLEEY